jgi:HemX protein
MMLLTTYIVFYLATAAYAAGAVLSLMYLRDAEMRVLTWARYALVAGVAGSLGTLALRWMAWAHLPLTTMTDSLNLLALFSGLIIWSVLRWQAAPALLCFYMPPLAAICVLNAVAAHSYLPLEPRMLNGAFLSVHVGLAILAYAMFFVASMTCVAYMFLAQRLKAHQTSGLFRKLPSLEDLDLTLYRLIRYGYPFFVATLFLGLIWAFWDRELLGAYWWLSPKVLLSYGMAGFYAVTFHLRRGGRLRGPKLARLVFWGFVLLISGYVVLSMLHLRGYHFWSSGT